MFVICTIAHFLSSAWMGTDWIASAMPICIMLGVVLPSIVCCTADDKFKKKQLPLQNRPEQHHVAAPRVVFAPAQPLANAIELPVAQATATPIVEAVVVDAVPIEFATEVRPAPLPGGASPQDAPPLVELVRLFRFELQLDESASISQVVSTTATQLGLPPIEGEPLMQKARRCWEALGSPTPSPSAASVPV